MTSVEVQSYPVLIVGAGPAGLVTAISLARYGVASLLVERRPDPSTLPRATGVSTRTMEILRGWGLEAQVRAGEMQLEPLARISETLASPTGMPMKIGYPTREEAAAVSPTAPALAPQDYLEPVLLTHLRTYPTATVRVGTELLALDQDDDGITALLRESGSDRTSVVRARYVVGADGAHSTVRDQLGIRLDGPDHLVDHATALFRAPLADVGEDRRYGLYIITHPGAAGVLVPAGQDRWLYSQAWEPGSESVHSYSEERFVELIRAATGVPDLRPRIERTGAFSFAAQVADRYRERHGFVVGDAAHRVTPRGGTGMNTAIHDAYDLGWKLAWVQRGWAGADLLDSYEADRRPVGLRSTARSADPDGSRREVEEALPDDLGGRVAHAWLVRDGRRVSTLDLVGTGLTLFTGPNGGQWQAAAATLDVPAPVTVERLTDDSARALGIGPGGAVLLRPDAHIVAEWSAAMLNPGEELRRAIDDLRTPACNLLSPR